ncbi:MAG: DEAD/DEAH box helicase [Gammaproteobacteria bacterium]
MHFFSEATRAWFNDAFEAPTPVQAQGWPAIARGQHALMVAPTGSGKTLAAFLWGIDSTLSIERTAAAGVRVLYVSPLKALVYDVERNLRAPLVGIRHAANRLGVSVREVGVAVRTGDTPQKERQAMARNPADILVTTPESLYLMLGSKAAATLASVHTVIVDEVHALAPTKRGVHLALSLERLALLTTRDPQRIGLSATVRPTDEVARFLAGDREVEVIDCATPPRLDLTVTVPVPDMENVHVPPPQPRSGPILGELYAREVGTPQTERGIWSAIYPEVLDRILANRSTIVFVNSRALAERLSQRLNELAGIEEGEPELVLAHHGSVSHEQRTGIEERLKAGEVKGIVATSSLELGIDMGAVDEVILVESPGWVARGLQRVGRAGHQFGAVSTGRLYPKFRGDLLEAAVVGKRMLEGAIESIRIPRNALDVLGQQMVAAVCDRPCTGAELLQFARRAHPYRDLPADALTAMLEMLSGNYPSSDFADLRPRLAWNRTTDVVSARRGTAMVARVNAGTIPDRGNYGVHLGEAGPRVGELDEEMVFESRAGDLVVLGASTWRIETITRDRVIVSPAPGEPGRLPFWRGDGPGRPIELGEALGAFTREVGGVLAREGMEGAQVWLLEHAPLDRFAARNLAAYLAEQREHTGTLPTDRAITVERFRDELGDWRVCVLSPFGSRIHAPWAIAIKAQLEARHGFEVQVMYTDDGIVLRLADTQDTPPLDELLPEAEAVEDLVTAQLSDTALFAGLFRENAVRSLLLTRRRPGQRTPLWAQRQKAQSLLATVRRYPGFPVVLETYRQALSDVFDLQGLRELLRRVRSRQVRVDDVETSGASPFARSLVFAYVANYLYDQDAPLAERRAQALTLDQGLLRELLGQSELRELIDPQALSTLEAELQHLTEDRRARDADELHDVLRRIGDLSADELSRRSAGRAQDWIAQLVDARRAVEIGLARQRRYIAAQDAGLYRDAFGSMPPTGLPASYLEPVDQPLETLLARCARSRGPFTSAELGARYDVPPAQLEPALRVLEARGALVHGEIRPGGSQLEWCDAEVLRRLKRRTLAALRNEAAAVDAATFAAFLAQWHERHRQGLSPDAPLPAADQLERAVVRLEGLALAWSTLAHTLLPARIPGFSLDQLDMLSANGRVVWVGCGALGANDGKVALYRRDQVARLLPAPPGANVAELRGRERLGPDQQSDDEPDAGPALDADPIHHSPIHDTLLQHLRQRGASFLTELEDAVRRAWPETVASEFEAALWDLVWAGVITNDTFGPLRALGRKARPGRGRGSSRLAGGRWALVQSLTSAPLSPTERTLAHANMLLERYGIVSRSAAQAEALAGGFAPLYKVLKTMEDAGRARRGYFVEGLPGAQFGQIGAVDRLRGARPDRGAPGPRTADDVLALAAIDPANPYGALLPWPETGAAGDDRRGRPRRVPGAWVLGIGGRPILYLSASRREVLTFPAMIDTRAGDLLACIRCLGSLPHGRNKLLIVERVDGARVEESPHAALWRQAGFVSDYRGLTLAGV